MIPHQRFGGPLCYQLHHSCVRVTGLEPAHFLDPNQEPSSKFGHTQKSGLDRPRTCNFRYFTPTLYLILSYQPRDSPSPIRTHKRQTAVSDGHRTRNLRLGKPVCCLLHYGYKIICSCQCSEPASPECLFPTRHLLIKLLRFPLMELKGLEPLTSCLQGRRSPS